MVEVRLQPTGGESDYATVARWLKQVGDGVRQGEALLEIETDKVTLEVVAPASGVLSSIVALEGDEVEVGELLGALDVIGPGGGA